MLHEYWYIELLDTNKMNTNFEEKLVFWQHTSASSIHVSDVIKKIWPFNIFKNRYFLKFVYKERERERERERCTGYTRHHHNPSYVYLSSVCPPPWNPALHPLGDLGIDTCLFSQDSTWACTPLQKPDTPIN